MKKGWAALAGGVVRAKQKPLCVLDFAAHMEDAVPEMEGQLGDQNQSGALLWQPSLPESAPGPGQDPHMAVCQLC